VLAACLSAYSVAAAQAPTVQCTKRKNATLSSSFIAYGQSGTNLRALDLTSLPSLLFDDSDVLEPSLGAKVGIRRVIAPDLLNGLVLVGNQQTTISASAVDTQRCARAALSVNRLTPSKTDPNYLCSLIELDDSCMTKSEAQPHVPDPGLPKRSVVAILLDKAPFCSGILLSKSRLATVRHCFVRREDGRLLPEIAQAKQSAVRFESVDGSRSGILSVSLLEALELNRGFDIEEDAVELSVALIEESGAAPLPRVTLTQPSVGAQALWVGGPVNDLRVALVAAATPGLSGEWQDGFRWSRYIGAMCRSKGTSSNCIYHTCQTFVGFSGSPLITRAFVDIEGPVVEYAGLHSGAPGKHPDGFERCVAPQTAVSPNDLRKLNVANKSK
jgi:V8-like Glu-specific endopeptidase